MLTFAIVAIATSFVRNEVNVGDSVGLLVEVAMPNDAQLETLSLSSVTVRFSGGIADWVIEHDASLASPATVSWAGDRKANLDFHPSRTLRIVGSVSSKTVTQIAVSQLKEWIARPGQKLRIAFQVQDVILALDTSSWKLRMHSGENLPLVDSVLGPMSFPVIK